LNSERYSYEKIADPGQDALRRGSLPGPWFFAGAALFVAILYWARVILIPIALATLLTFLLAPMVSGLERWRLSRGLSVTVVVLLTFTMLGGMVGLAALQVRNLGDELPQYRANIRQKVGDLRKFQNRSALEKIGTMMGQVQSEFNKNSKPSAPTALAAAPSDQPLIPDSIKQPLTITGLVFLLLIYMLAQREELRNRIVALMGYGNLPITTHALEEMGERISKYLLTQLAINTSFGLLVAIALALIELPYAFLWGFLAALFIFVPVIGFWLAAGLPTALSLAVFTSWVWPLAVLGLFIVLKTVNNVLLEPWLYGKSAGVLQVPLLILLAFWTWLWGPVGLILATPLTVCLLVFAKHVPQLEFLSLLISDKPVMASRIQLYQRLLALDYDEAAAIVEDYLREHSSEEVYDGLLLPALCYAKTDRRRGLLSERQESFIFDSLRTLHEESIGEPVGGNSQTAARAEKIQLLGCPADGAADELALYFLCVLLGAQRFECEIVGPATLAAETAARVGERSPAVVVIAALPPGGLAQTRYLCKRLRRAFPQLKIIVLRWALAGDRQQDREACLAAGADNVALTIPEARGQIGNLALLEN
jgi:predicted PurR-regulated permease PerM